MAVGDLDSNGQADVIIGFGSLGLWAYKSGGPTQRHLHSTPPSTMAIGETD